MLIRIDDQDRVFVLYGDSGPYTVLNPDGTTEESFMARGELVYEDEL